MATTEIRIKMPYTGMRRRDFVAVARAEWESVQQRVKELEHALRVIASGERAIRRGKTRVVGSLHELLR